MAIAGGVHIRVNPAELNQKAQSVSRSISNMERQFEQLETIINRTNSYWIGEAGNMHRQIYQNQKPKVEEMMKRLKEHPSDLALIAQNYMDTESSVTSIAADLPGDVIR